MESVRACVRVWYRKEDFATEYCCELVCVSPELCCSMISSPLAPAGRCVAARLPGDHLDPFPLYLLRICTERNNNNNNKERERRDKPVAAGVVLLLLLLLLQRSAPPAQLQPHKPPASRNFLPYIHVNVHISEGDRKCKRVLS